MKHHLTRLFLVVLTCVCLLMGLLLARTGLPLSLTHAQVTTTAPRLPIPVKVFFLKGIVMDNVGDGPTLVSVTRYSPSASVESFALSQIIAGPTLEERGQGLWSDWNSMFSGPPTCDYPSSSTNSPPGVQGNNINYAYGGRDFNLIQNMKGNTRVPGWVTLHLCRDVANEPTSGDVALVENQVTTTLSQFTSMKGVTILTVDGHCFENLFGHGIVPDSCLK